MQTLSFQQNTGFNTGALIKRNRQGEANHDAIRSAVRAWAAAEGQDVVSAYIIDEWRQQGGEEITFPDDISRARQKLFATLTTRPSSALSRVRSPSYPGNHGRSSAGVPTSSDASGRYFVAPVFGHEGMR